MNNKQFALLIKVLANGFYHVCWCITQSHNYKLRSVNTDLKTTCPYYDKKLEEDVKEANEKTTPAVSIPLS